MADVTQQIWIHEGASGALEKIEQPPADQHVLRQRDGSVLVHHDGGVTAYGLDPATELLGVADRRGQADQQHVVGQVQDDLLPHRTAHPVGEEVHLVHHDVGKPLQCSRIRIQHVAQHFGGHHHDVGITVDGLVAGEQSDLVGAVAGHQVVVFLVAQRLDRCGVEALSAGRQGQMHGELAHDRLARTRGRTHQHTVPAFERAAGAQLEIVECERVFGGEPGQFTTGGTIGLRWHRRRSATAPTPAP